MERVIFDDNRKAVGVVFRSSADFQVGSKQETRTINARKQVVLSAGALGTPQILERSGVGNSEVLSRARVPLVASVPGVGENYLVRCTLKAVIDQITKMPSCRITISCCILTKPVSAQTRQWTGFSQDVSTLPT